MLSSRFCLATCFEEHVKTDLTAFNVSVFSSVMGGGGGSNGGCLCSPALLKQQAPHITSPLCRVPPHWGQILKSSPSRVSQFCSHSTIVE